MNDLIRMAMCNRLNNLFKVMASLLFCEMGCWLACDVLEQLFTRDILLNKEKHAFCVVCFKVFNDVGVIQPSQYLNFLHQVLHIEVQLLLVDHFDSYTQAVIETTFCKETFVSIEI